MVAFFDTNILVYLADNRDARKQSIALELVKAALVKRIDAWISVQALTELQYYDSVMLAAAEQMGATIFYNEDLNDGQVYAGVKAVNPFAKPVKSA